MSSRNEIERLQAEADYYRDPGHGGFDARGVRRASGVLLVDGALRMCLDAPAFDQRIFARLGHDAFETVWPLAETPATGRTT